MRYGLMGIATFLLMLLSPWPATFAKTQWQSHQILRFENEPLDMLVANRARRVYVLNAQGEILVYTFSGQLKGKINVGTDVAQIKAGPRDDVLFLLRKKDKSIQSITISVTEEIDISGAPFKGELDAPVTIAVFSDFQ